MHLQLLEPRGSAIAFAVPVSFTPYAMTSCLVSVPYSCLNIFSLYYLVRNTLRKEDFLCADGVLSSVRCFVLHLITAAFLELLFSIVSYCSSL